VVNPILPKRLTSFIQFLRFYVKLAPMPKMGEGFFNWGAPPDFRARSALPVLGKEEGMLS
jgi:hypothetical protein